jgi:hypothetical protein
MLLFQHVDTTAHGSGGCCCCAFSSAAAAFPYSVFDRRAPGQFQHSSRFPLNANDYFPSALVLHAAYHFLSFSANTLMLVVEFVNFDISSSGKRILRSPHSYDCGYLSQFRRRLHDSHGWPADYLPLFLYEFLFRPSSPPHGCAATIIPLRIRRMTVNTVCDSRCDANIPTSCTAQFTAPFYRNWAVALSQLNCWFERNRSARRGRSHLRLIRRKLFADNRALLPVQCLRTFAMLFLCRMLAAALLSVFCLMAQLSPVSGSGFFMNNAGSFTDAPLRVQTIDVAAALSVSLDMEDSPLALSDAM